MSCDRAQVKLVKIQPCLDLDDSIRNYIGRNKVNPELMSLLELGNTKQVKKSKKLSYKTSLVDWRTLFSQNRPKTQSLIHKNLNSNKNQTKFKTTYYSSSPLKDKAMKYWPNPIQKQMRVTQSLSRPTLTSKTAMNFYGTPIGKELSIKSNFINLVEHPNNFKSPRSNFRPRRTHQISFSNLTNHQQLHPPQF